jgi:hypothetical protein
VNNDKCTLNSLIFTTVDYEGAGSCMVNLSIISEGAFRIKMTNTGGTALDTSALIGFIVL